MLLNLGVEATHPAIQKAVTALLSPEIASAHKNWFRGGAALDADGRGGDRAIAANIFAMTKAPEDIPVYSEQLSIAFDHLLAVLEYDSIDDFSIKGKNERYYKPHARFPGANHIGILAAAQGWRTDDNMKTAKAAVKRAYEIMKDVDEYISFKKPSEFGGGFVGPFNYNWQALKPMTEEQIGGIMNSSYNFQFAFWLGAITGVPDWAQQHNDTYEALANMLDRKGQQELYLEQLNFISSIQPVSVKVADTIEAYKSLLFLIFTLPSATVSLSEPDQTNLSDSNEVSSLRTI